jgi:hypothetical protein
MDTHVSARSVWALPPFIQESGACTSSGALRLRPRRLSVSRGAHRTERFGGRRSRGSKACPRHRLVRGPAREPLRRVPVLFSPGERRSASGCSGRPVRFARVARPTRRRRRRSEPTLLRRWSPPRGRAPPRQRRRGSDAAHRAASMLRRRRTRQAVGESERDRLAHDWSEVPRRQASTLSVVREHVHDQRIVVERRGDHACRLVDVVRSERNDLRH